MFVKHRLKNNIWIYHKNHAMHCSLEIPEQHQPKPLSLHSEHSVFVVLMKNAVELFFLRTKTTSNTFSEAFEECFQLPK